MSEIDLTRDQTEASGKPDLTDLGRALTDGTLTSAELTEAALARAEEDDALRSSFISLTPDRALEEAQASDARRRAGESRGSLDGIPVAWKDLFDVEGTLTTAGSACRGEEQHAAADAPVVAALAEAGMVCIGKTNLSELAFSGLGTNSHFGTPINPHRADRVPGGSSSGAAVAVATGAVTSAIGTDTAGSVRVPAALCGVVGYKTSSSRLPREGVFALAPALDTIGVLATSVAACAMVEAAMRGDAPLVPTADQPEQLRLIVPTGVLIEDIDPDVAETTERALSALTDAGASIERRKVSALEATQALFAKHGPLSVADAGRHHSALLDSPAAELLEPIVRQRLEFSLERVEAVERAADREHRDGGRQYEGVYERGFLRGPFENLLATRDRSFGAALHHGAEIHDRHRDEGWCCTGGNREVCGGRGQLLGERQVGGIRHRCGEAERDDASPGVQIGSAEERGRPRRAFGGATA